MSPVAAEPVLVLPGRGPVELVETHISWVFLAGERAYKVRKPVVMPFLDYGTVERRRHMAEEEVRLGRRLAPDLYLGVRPLYERDGKLVLDGSGDPVEYAVEMKRFAVDQTLESWLREGDLDPGLIAKLGEEVAAFHRALPPVAGWGPEQVSRAVDDNFSSLLGADLDDELAGLVHAGHRFAAAFLDGRRGLLAARAQEHVRDGHGDLRADHVVIGETIQVFDPVEFDPALRRTDVSADLAFLIMDLERFGRPDVAAGLLSAYRGAGGDPGDDSLVYFYAAYRAWVRAKVESLRDLQRGGGGGGNRVRDLADLADRLAWRARSPLTLVVCGSAASGKSYLARHLAARAGAAHVSSDIVRKRLLGLEARRRAPAGAYGEEWNRRTYAELGREAARSLERTGMVVVDATFRHRDDRDAFAGAYVGAEPLFVECRAPREVLVSRATARTRERTDASDADAAVALDQLEGFEPLDEVPAARHLVVRTDRPVSETLADLTAMLDDRL